MRPPAGTGGARVEDEYLADVELDGIGQDVEATSREHLDELGLGGERISQAGRRGTRARDTTGRVGRTWRPLVTLWLNPATSSPSRVPGRCQHHDRRTARSPRLFTRGVSVAGATRLRLLAPSCSCIQQATRHERPTVVLTGSS